MLNHFLNAFETLIPILMVMIFGFLIGKSHLFGQNTAEKNHVKKIINEFVLNIALPPALFYGTIIVSKKVLFAESSLFIVLLMTILLIYFIGFYLIRFVFKRNIIESAIAGIGIAFAAGPFYGPALLSHYYQSSADIAVSFIAIALNVFLIPIATLIIRSQTETDNTEQSAFIRIFRSIFQTIYKTPYVWAPILAFILVAIDVRLPSYLESGFKLIGDASAGTAIFVSGMTLSFVKFQFNLEALVVVALKNILMPLLFIALVMILPITLNTQSFNEGVMLSALPSGPMLLLLSTKYQQYQKEAASIFILSTGFMLISLTLFIAFLKF